MGSVDLSRRDTIPAPFIAQSTGRWDGDIGSWSTFTISIGTPPQSFRVLPATVDPHVSVPITEGCAGGLQNLTDCGDRRGVNYFNGAPSRGFAWSGSSSTFNLFNVYNEYTGQSVFSATGPFGNDTLSLNAKGGSANITMPKQVIAGISSADFWLGTLGLGNAFTNYAANSFVAPSLLYNMKNQSYIPSISYGYTAGRYYDLVDGSLILGGYDSNKLSSSLITTNIQPSNSTQRLNINIQSLILQHEIDGGSSNVLSQATVASIDSSIDNIWLPEQACDILANNLGLTYDANYNFYLINDTMHNTLRANNATLTFILGGDSGTTNIVLPYKSLDMQIGIPWYSPSVNYFPLRRAANSSQVILGRTFLQEAYLVVDWERSNFTISQLNKASTTANVLAITTPSVTPSAATVTPAASSAAASNQSSSTGGGIGAGAIAGIVIGVLLIAALGGLFFWMRRRPKHKRWSTFSFRKSVESQPPPAYDTGAEFYGGDKSGEVTNESKGLNQQLSELYDSSQPRAELTSDNVRRLEQIAQERELMSTPVAELVGDAAGTEMEVTSNPERESVISGHSATRTSVASPHRTSVLGPERAKSPLSSSPLFEME